MTSAVKAPFQVFLKLHITWGYLCPRLCARKRHEIFRLHSRGGWVHTDWTNKQTERKLKLIRRNFNWRSCQKLISATFEFSIFEKKIQLDQYWGGGGNTFTMKQTIIQENYKCDQVTAIESNLKHDVFFPKKFSII